MLVSIAVIFVWGATSCGFELARPTSFGATLGEFRTGLPASCFIDVPFPRGGWSASLATGDWSKQAKSWDAPPSLFVLHVTALRSPASVAPSFTEAVDACNDPRAGLLFSAIHSSSFEAGAAFRTFPSE